MVRDPVCGMEIDPKKAFATREHMESKYFTFAQKTASRNLMQIHINTCNQFIEPAGSATYWIQSQLNFTARLNFPFLGLPKKGNLDRC